MTVTKEPLYRVAQVAERDYWCVVGPRGASLMCTDQRAAEIARDALNHEMSRLAEAVALLRECEDVLAKYADADHSDAAERAVGNDAYHATRDVRRFLSRLPEEIK